MTPDIDYDTCVLPKHDMNMKPPNGFDARTISCRNYQFETPKIVICGSQTCYTFNEEENAHFNEYSDDQSFYVFEKLPKSIYKHDFTDLSSFEGQLMRVGGLAKTNGNKTEQFIVNIW